MNQWHRNLHIDENSLSISLHAAKTDHKIYGTGLQSLRKEIEEIR